jgi:hypothetical protein
MTAGQAQAGRPTTRPEIPSAGDLDRTAAGAAQRTRHFPVGQTVPCHGSGSPGRRLLSVPICSTSYRFLALDSASCGELPRP